MKINADLETLEQDIENQIQSFKNRRLINKKRASRVVVWGAILSAVTTILVSMASFFEGNINKAITIFAIVTNSSLAILHAWDNLFNHKRLWIIYADTLTKLYELRDDLKHIKATNPENSTDAINLLYKEYKNVLRASNENWKSLKLETEDNSSSTQKPDQDGGAP